jgi:hypothetical protein
MYNSIPIYNKFSEDIFKNLINNEKDIWKGSEDHQDIFEEISKGLSKSNQYLQGGMFMRVIIQ